ncbi:MAG TPA: hypothetical protein DD400_02485 [Rhodospirillaceae bacterium]|nr:hypothetical protein [Rhodospirillaceae bacterium]
MEEDRSLDVDITPVIGGVFSCITNYCHDYHGVMNTGHSTTLTDLLCVSGALCGRAAREFSLETFPNSGGTEKSLVRVLWGEAGKEFTQCGSDTLLAWFREAPQVGISGKHAPGYKEIRAIDKMEKQTNLTFPLGYDKRFGQVIPLNLAASDLWANVFGLAQSVTTEGAHFVALWAGVYNSLHMLRQEPCFLYKKPNANKKIAQKMLFRSVWGGAKTKPLSRREIENVYKLALCEGPCQ